jgi:hypothetical protein
MFPLSFDREAVKSMVAMRHLLTSCSPLPFVRSDYTPGGAAPHGVPHGGRGVITYLSERFIAGFTVGGGKIG